MQTVVETSIFSRQAEKLFSEDEKMEVIGFLAANPLLGDEVAGTGGVRKLRVPASGRGKRGGARIIYYVLNNENPIYALLVYGKNEQTDLSPDQRVAVTGLARAIKSEWRRRTT
jgi:mRNA-degrading endonuclease RelE of RelBE toxin-antitoxin system